MKTADPPPARLPPLHPSRTRRDRYLLWTQLVNLLCRLLGSDRLSGRLRQAVLRAYGWQIGPDTQLDGLRYAYGRVHIGARTYINREAYFEGAALITIGSRVHIGPNVQLLTASHAIGPPTRRGGPLRFLPLTVGDGVWIGAGAILLPGVTVGAGAVVAAGAVVTTDVPANTLVAGVPARVKRQLSET